MRSYDVTVIGGGILGITSAYFLAKMGKKVAIIEKEHVANGTTSNSFAWINASSKAGRADYHKLNASGLAGYNQLAQEFGERSLGLNPCGQLYVAKTEDQARHGELIKRWQLLQAQSYPCTWVNTNDLRNLEPSINCSQEYEALYNYAELCLDAPRFSKFLAERLIDEGGSIFEATEVLSLDIDEFGLIRSLETNNGKIATDQVLLAAGQNTPDMLADLTGFAGFANRFPLHKSPGILITTPDLGFRQLTRRVIYWEQTPDFHILPHFSGGWRMGADDIDGLIADNDTREKRQIAGECLLERARERLVGVPDNLSIADCDMRVGIRPIPEDGVSIADILPGSKNFFVVVTHSGVTLAPVIGQQITEFMVTGTRPVSLVPYSLERFPGFV